MTAFGQINTRFFVGKTWTFETTSLHECLRLRQDLGHVLAVGLEDGVEALGGRQDVSLVLHRPRVVASLQAQQLEILQ